MSDSKLVAQMSTPDTDKTPVSAHPPDSSTGNMSWTKDRHDAEGAWTWGVSRACEETIWKEAVAPKLLEWEKKTWLEVRAERTNNGPKHHEYDVAVICQEAFDRLEVLKLDDQDNIFRFRLAGKKRLYGFILDAVFNSVWYDPTHSIYPVELGGKKDLEKKKEKKAVKKREQIHVSRKAARKAAGDAALKTST